MTEKELQIWKHRWRTLKHTIEDMENNLKREQMDEAGRPITRTTTIQTLLRCLLEFGETQFDFFYRGFNDEDETGGYLKPSLEYPEEYVFRTTLTQISHDLNLFQTVIQQRETAGKDERMQAALDTADHLAYKALKPAVEGGLIKEATVLTYFQKIPSVRLVPYAPIALVAIPYSCMMLADEDADSAMSEAATRDFLAIPHEVGHYVYRHGQFNRDTLDEALRDRLIQEEPIFGRWLEEIFADVYGCLVAGPVMAIDFMHLLLDHNPREFVAFDQDHPTAAIRPWVYFEVLGEIKCGEAADALCDMWKKILKERSHYVDAKAHEYLEGLQRVAHDVYELQHFVTHPFDRERWTNNTDQVGKLYATFAQFVANEKQNVDITIIPEATVCTDKPHKAEVNGRRWRMGESDGLNNLWIDQLRYIAKQNKEGSHLLLSSQIKIPPQVWSLVFSMNGWAIEGPMGMIPPIIMPG